jgi:hypothetical protein
MVGVTSNLEDMTRRAKTPTLPKTGREVFCLSIYGVANESTTLS